MWVREGDALVEPPQYFLQAVVRLLSHTMASAERLPGRMLGRADALAEVIATVALADHVAGVDLEEALLHKIEVNRHRFPIETAYGHTDKTARSED